MKANAAVEQGRENARVRRCPTDALTVSIDWDGELAVGDIKDKDKIAKSPGPCATYRQHYLSISQHHVNVDSKSKI